MIPEEVKYKIDLMIFAFNEAYAHNFGVSCDDPVLYVSSSIKRLMGDKYTLDINGVVSEYPLKTSALDFFDDDTIYIISASDHQRHIDEVESGKSSHAPMYRKML